MMETASLSWKKILGVSDIRAGNEVGDRSIKEIFTIASKSGSGVRFLRLGGPSKFRAEVIAFVSRGGTTTPAYQMLLDPNIREIEFLLANPYSESFLSRMDEENQDNWEIWRVKDQVLKFARGLLRASEQRAFQGLSKIKLAFHSADLIWNIDIADDQLVIIRSYHKSATGHDSKIPEIKLEIGSGSRLAESLISYYNHIKTDINTKFIQSEKDLESIGTFPSLFKSNAILDPSDTLSSCIEKSCYYYRSQQSEMAWLSYQQDEAPMCYYFSPVRQEKKCERTDPWAGTTSRIHRVEGVTAAEFLWHIQQIGDIFPEYKEKLGILIGSIVYQAFRSLVEFRKVGENVYKLKSETAHYPWEQKLSSAMKEIFRFVSEDIRELSRCNVEILHLTKELDKSCIMPFRDAHLKNRMIAIDRKFWANDYKLFCQFLTNHSAEELFWWLKDSTFDIDFETCFWLVTEWDDPLHIFWSNNLGINQTQDLTDGLGKFESWWPSPKTNSDKNIFWKTLFCRSFREHCRRLWYDHLMPTTYQYRYGREKRGHFLQLALVAMAHIDGLDALKDFLLKSEELDDMIWNRAAKRDVHEPVAPIISDFVIGNHDDLEFGSYQVFLCHNSKDKASVKRIGLDLIEQGIRPWLDEWELRPGFPWQEELEKQIKSINAAAVFVGEQGTGPWQNMELRAFLEEFLTRKCPVIPVILPECKKVPNLPVFLRGMTWVDFRKRDPNPLKQLIYGITGSR